MPEEVNRLITDEIAQLLLAPTEGAVANLLSEGADPRRVFFVGNLMAQSLFNCLETARQSSILKQLGLDGKEYGVLTVHRPENTGSPVRLLNIFKGLRSVRFPIIFPVHPRTAKQLVDPEIAGIIDASSVKCVSPLNYLDFTQLQAQSRLIITDSGGMQEEAFLLKIPCLTLRYNTERALTIDMGGNKLVGAEPDLIACGLANPPAPDRWTAPPRWDAFVARRILEILDNHQELLRIEPATRLSFSAGNVPA